MCDFVVAHFMDLNVQALLYLPMSLALVLKCIYVSVNRGFILKRPYNTQSPAGGKDK